MLTNSGSYSETCFYIMFHVDPQTFDGLGLGLAKHSTARQMENRETRFLMGFGLAL